VITTSQLRESPETVEEAPDGAEPRPATVGLRRAHGGPGGVGCSGGRGVGPQDPKDVTRDTARDLSGMAGELVALKADARH
jgi:hypothetical protein